MSNKFKDIDIKNRTYNPFVDMISIKNLDPNKIKIDEKSYKNVLFYQIGYVIVKDLNYVKINNVNFLYVTINKTSGYIDKINRNKY